MRRLLPLAVGVVLLSAGCSLSRTASKTTIETTTVVRTVTAPATTTTNATEPCAGTDLRATFDVQAGSAGAGNIVYTLTIINSSSAACSFDGVPQVQLFDKDGNELPTHAIAVPDSTFPGVVLQPGGSQGYDARFSPDVAGTGDHQGGKCQPTAATLRVTPPGGGNVDAPVSPPTSVCEQGQLSLRPSS